MDVFINLKIVQNKGPLDRQGVESLREGVRPPH